MTTAVDATTPVIDIGDLGDLMRAVNDTTERLRRTHVTLQRQVASLQAELAEANEQLRRSRALAALGEMAAGIAHEVRNPLGSIQLDAQNLAEDVAGQPGPAQLCERILRAVQGLDAIVNDVLLFARDTVPRTQPVPVAALVDRALASCESLASEGGIEIRRDEGAERAVVEADVTLMTQALGNVCRNAVEAMVESARAPRVLAIRAERARRRGADGASAPCTVLAVEDSGPGIPPEVVERMFNPFFTTRHTGTGLGLAIVHRIVEAHGGHVAVRAAPGGGARVEICLPETPAGAETQNVEGSR